MRRGCMSLGDIQCDECHRTILSTERYLAIDEESSVEVEKGKTGHYCVQCALQKGYAHYKDGEKHEKTLTFFP